MDVFRQPQSKTSIFWLTKAVAKLSLSAFFKIRTSGLRNLPEDDAFILAPKHQRWEDIPLLGLATPRPLYYVAKYELFQNPVLRWYVSALGGIPLNRERPLESRGALRRMIDYLHQGEGIVIFPEGTYYKNRMGPGHVGLIRMVLSRIALPFVPVGIKYEGKRIRREVRMNFGRPIFADSSESADRLLNQIMKEIARLSFP